MAVNVANVPATSFGAVSSAGSGVVLAGGVLSVPGWAAARAARCVSILGIAAAQVGWDYSDLTDGGALTPGAKSAGATATTYPTSPRGGYAFLSTSASANNWAALGYSANGGVANPKTEKWWLGARLQYSASDANSSHQLALSNGMGGLDATTGVNVGVGVNVVNGVASLVCNLVGTVTSVALTWTFDSAAYHDIDVGFDGTTLIAYVDSIEAARTTTLTNLLSSAGCGHTASVANGATAAIRTLRVEKLGLWFDQGP